MGTWLKSHEQEVAITLFLSMLLSFLVCIGLGESSRKALTDPYRVPNFTDAGERVNQSH